MIQQAHSWHMLQVYIWTRKVNNIIIIIILDILTVIRQYPVSMVGGTKFCSTITYKHMYVPIWKCYVMSKAKCVEQHKKEIKDANPVTNLYLDRNDYKSLIITCMLYGLMWESVHYNRCPSNNGVTFWTHEWTKHGTCSESVLNKHGYFHPALNLKKQANLLQIIRNADNNTSRLHGV